MKRKLLAMAAALFCMAAVVGGTLAFFTSEATSHNVITTGAVAIKIDEQMAITDENGTVTGYEKFPEEGIKDVMPGTQQSKIVRVKNTEQAEAWVRASVAKSFELAEGRQGQIDPELVTLDINEDAWLDGGDGYYYCKKAVKPGEMTEPLFTTVTFKTEMGNLYQNSTAHVNVYAQAVQTASNPIPKGGDVSDVLGWPANDEGKV